MNSLANCSLGRRNSRQRDDENYDNKGGSANMKPSFDERADKRDCDALTKFHQTIALSVIAILASARFADEISPPRKIARNYRRVDGAIAERDEFEFGMSKSAGLVNTSLFSFLSFRPATSRSFVFTAKHCYADGSRRHCCSPTTNPFS